MIIGKRNIPNGYLFLALFALALLVMWLGRHYGDTTPPAIPHPAPPRLQSPPTPAERSDSARWDSLVHARNAQ